MNTRIDYFYRDGANYKLPMYEIVSGTIDIQGFYDDRSFNADYFYPAKIGFCADTFVDRGYKAYDDDPDFHEIYSLEETNMNPTVEMTAEEFWEACRNGACERRIPV